MEINFHVKEVKTRRGKLSQHQDAQNSKENETRATEELDNIDQFPEDDPSLPITDTIKVSSNSFTNKVNLEDVNGSNSTSIVKCTPIYEAITQEKREIRKKKQNKWQLREHVPKKRFVRIVFFTGLCHFQPSKAFCRMHYISESFIY